VSLMSPINMLFLSCLTFRGRAKKAFHSSAGGYCGIRNVGVGGAPLNMRSTKVSYSEYL
jgi:hypothetical protein